MMKTLKHLIFIVFVFYSFTAQAAGFGGKAADSGNKEKHLLSLTAVSEQSALVRQTEFAEEQSAPDFRNIQTGHEIPSENYSDQPYVVITRDGNWLSVMTTGRGREGQLGQHIVATISSDKGKTWSELIDIEPADGPEASWVVPLIVPSGRVYVFYTYNADNMREVKDYSGKLIRRVDTIGKYMFKYSDDNGRTWSEKRYEIPMRVTEIDRNNVYGGKVFFFWGIGKPITDQGSVFWGASKVGNFGYGFMESSEGMIFRSDNILTENDPEKIEWVMLPDGDVGLRSPEGPVSDEHNLAALSDGSLYCMYRTIDGHPCHAYSRDRGHTWTKPEHASYTPGGRKIKHPRACPRLWKTKNGRFLFWFHNNGTRWYNNGKTAGNRNVAWLTGGVEKNGYIYWSQPEIVLYDDEHFNGASYPDLIEQDGRYFITATQKVEARVHEIDPALLEGLWNQENNKNITRDGLVLDLSEEQCRSGTSVPAPVFPLLSGEIERRSLSLKGRGGFSIDFWIRFSDLEDGQIILDGREKGGKGIVLAATDRQTIRIEMCDGWTSAFWDCDEGILRPDVDHHVAAIVDGGPKIISFVIDGVLCDGGEERPFGWGRFKSTFRDINGADQLHIAPKLHGTLKSLRVYNRYLRTSEAIGNFRAGLK